MRWGAFLVVMLAVPAAAGAQAPSDDVNGDGLADVVVTDYRDSIDSSGATVIFGSRERDRAPDRAAPGADGFRIVAQYSLEGAQIAGDVNGDRLADVLVLNGAQLDVVFGKRDAKPVRLQGLERRGEGATVYADATIAAAVGDVNGDGLGDVAFSIGVGRRIARVFLGGRRDPLGRTFVVRGAGRIRTNEKRSELGAAGDLDGDGIGDLALGVDDPDGRHSGFDHEELVLLLRGRRRWPTQVAVSERSGARLLRHTRDCTCALNDLAAVGDVTADGRADLAVSWWAYAGGPDRIDVFSRAGRRRSTIFGTTFVGVPVSLGDVTGDRRRDLLVPSPSGHKLRIVDGHRLPTARIDARKAAPGIAGVSITNAEAAGDVDGDGHPDALLGWGHFDVDRWSIVYGASPLDPVDLRAPGPAATTIR